ncbi:MAG: hypothetical protein ACLFN5_01580 [bacterium]
MARRDMEINREIDRALVRQDVNTRKLKWRTIGSRVNFIGELTKRHGKEIEDKDEVKQLDKRIKRIDGVMTVEWDLKNWEKEHGQWKKKKDKRDGLRHQVQMKRQSGIQLDW